MIKNKMRIIEEVWGFSLVEICIVLCVAMMLAAFAVPALSTSMRSMQLTADTRNIATTLTCAKLSATSQMTRYRLSFNLTGNQWSLEKFNKGTGAFELQQAANMLANGVANSEIAFKTSSSSAPSGLPTTSSSAITFNSRGIPVDAAGVPTANNVVYISKSDTDYAVGVSLAGKVQIWKRQDSQWVTQ
jgi:Tfp pilus assembly protein FimT